MKLYIAKATCSLAAQLVANELGLSPELIHYNVVDKSTSSNETFADVNPLGYVPVLELDNDRRDRITETIVVSSYLADQHPEAGLIPCARHGRPRQIRPASGLHRHRDRTEAHSADAQAADGSRCGVDAQQAGHRLRRPWTTVLPTAAFTSRATRSRSPTPMSGRRCGMNGPA